MVLDVGFIGLFTRCWPGLTGMVATGGGYRQASGCAWSSSPTRTG